MNTQQQPCTHARVEVHQRLDRIASLYEPAEYTVWGICLNCGEHLAEEDIPDDTEELEPDPELPGTPHEFYD